MNFNKAAFSSGILGGMFVLILILIFIFFIDADYYSYKIKVINPSKIDRIEKFSQKAKLIKELENDGILLSPAEYTSNVSEHYNTTIAILATMLLIFSIASYFHVKFISVHSIKEETEKLLTDSIKINELIQNSIFGIADQKFTLIEDFESLKARLRNLETNYEIIDENIEDETEFHLEEDV